MEITKVVKPFNRMGWPNTFGKKNVIVYAEMKTSNFYQSHLYRNQTDY